MNPNQITCAKCSKPVEKIEWWDDTISGGVVLRVYCHGETDEMRMSTGMLSSDLDELANSDGFVFFQEKPLLPPT